MIPPFSKKVCHKGLDVPGHLRPDGGIPREGVHRRLEPLQTEGPPGEGRFQAGDIVGVQGVGAGPGLGHPPPVHPELELELPPGEPAGGFVAKRDLPAVFPVPGAVPPGEGGQGRRVQQILGEEKTRQRVEMLIG